jgi:hypothetical protein
MANRHPVGGQVSAYTKDMIAGDPNGALEQQLPLLLSQVRQNTQWAML